MIRLFLSVEIIVFLTAAIMHFGIVIQGYEHEKARIAEIVIAVILLAGLLVGYIHPGKLKKSAVIVQSIALAGTFIGVFTIIVGVGPRSIPDYAFHTLMIFLLTVGLVKAKKVEETY